MEPSENGWRLPRTPALYASIMAGSATITLSTSSVRAEETTDQSSYPLKSENAMSPGDFSEYLSFFLRLRVKSHGADDSEYCNGDRNDGKAANRFHGDASFYLLVLLFLRRRFRSGSRHRVFSFTTKVSSPSKRTFRTIAI